MDSFNEQNNTVDLNNQVATPLEHKSAAGPIVGAVIIVLIVVLGGVYFWGSRMQTGIDEVAPTTTTQPVETVAPQADSVDQISNDLNATSATSADADLVGATDAIKGI